ncbi:MAG: CHAT domain-containing protein [Tolypothrix brevis GSE-NOS-MK-07-07A]|jgi:CHAT domain-containing protein|nr:CHAT domain-containing protein [Tolypothrix brevis GSE-NOS-MK-07-07A]
MADPFFDKQGRSEALRQVQLEMLRGDKYQHPYSVGKYKG